MAGKRIPIYGSILNQNPPCSDKDHFIEMPGSINNSNGSFYFGESTISKHIMLIGGTGSGKTNVFYHFISQLKKKMTENDVMIVFDAKGDYHSRFSDSDDCIIANSEEYTQKAVRWNIFKEIIADGWNEKSIEININEMTWALFRKSINESKDPFFPNAARDLFSAILFCMFKQGIIDEQYRKKHFYNSEIQKAINESSIKEIVQMLSSFPECVSVCNYLGNGENNQALGVYSEMLSTLRKILIGCFAEKGNFSIRDFVRKKGGRTLFIEYDLAIGDTLAPLYSLLVDLALKEALGRSKSKGKVYLICDEFRLLPHLQHIDNAVNLGRGLGVNVIAGLQSINQLAEVYGEFRAKNILAGFSSLIAFHANDLYTREYVTGLAGKSIVVEQYKTITGSLSESRQDANVVEDWEMNELLPGDAIVFFPLLKPFKFHFDLFRG